MDTDNTLKKEVQFKQNNMRKFLILLFVTVAFTSALYSQQDPQYTHYMYNTMSVNPAYVGTRGHITINALGRTQWVGFEGAPDTQTLSYDSPLGYTSLGLGVNLVNDVLGASHETYLDANVAYRIQTSEEGNLSFGLKLGGRLLNVDWSKGDYLDRDDEVLRNNINNKFLPSVGAGIYYYTSKFYVGLSVPNFIRTEHYDASQKIEKVAVERMHFFLISGLVFDLNRNIKFKPAVLFKGVSGAPLSLDVSANFLFNEQFTAGLSWRWDDSFSALVGFQASESLFLGYSYDLTTSNYSNYNSGTHEVMLRYELFKDGPVISPRFF
ncbi:type IX secretion system membrane protein PorP/SprF [Tenacibaculum sp. UWU-22]|uniref:PorP/SprF family type IX secretion system membrane protein n=1 Tax=Tenacibaculum sp. UWU-22 TaxID=3234187 RepID=UPI0034DB06E9